MFPCCSLYLDTSYFQLGYGPLAYPTLLHPEIRSPVTAPSLTLENSTILLFGSLGSLSILPIWMTKVHFVQDKIGESLCVIFWQSLGEKLPRSYPSLFGKRVFCFTSISTALCTFKEITNTLCHLILTKALWDRLDTLKTKKSAQRDFLTKLVS